MATSINLTLEPPLPGSKQAKEARMSGFIPVVLYGLNKENEYYSLRRTDFLKKVDGHQTELFNVKPKGKKAFSAVIKDETFNTLSGEYVHLDFMRVDAEVPISIMVPLRFEGEPTGVRIGGGILNKTLDEVEVECLPKDIPSEFVVDVSGLELDHKITAGDVKMPKGVEVISDKDLTLAVVHMKEEEPLDEDPSAETDSNESSKS